MLASAFNSVSADALYTSRSPWVNVSLPVIETPPKKREALGRLLDAGPAMVHLDPRHDGVLAPPELCSGPALRLKLSWHYAHPLHLDDEGIVQTLTFHSGSFRCAIPWEAIFAMGSAESEPEWVWPSDLPPEMRDLLLTATVRESDEGPGAPGFVSAPPPGVRPAPALAVVAEGAPAGEDEPPDDAPSDDDPPDDDPPGTIRRGHLRLVKG